MPDKTESAVRKLLARKNGHEKTIADVFELVFAMDEDGDARHAESMAKMGELEDRIIALEALPAQLNASHELKHADHMQTYHPKRRSTDEPDEDHCGEREDEARKVWVMWGLGTKAGAALLAIMTAVITATIISLINLRLYGHP